jgi:malonate-semialdehyde dehydrogenase (acetylating)/methylmalonate-semialdehyde dehydrogenase
MTPTQQVEQLGGASKNITIKLPRFNQETVAENRCHYEQPWLAGTITAMTDAPIRVPILCGGKWSGSDAVATSPVFNPSTGEVIAQVPFCDAAQTAIVIETAAAALPAWSDIPVVERARLMFRYREVLQRNFDRLAMSVIREHGKTLVEAKASVQRGIEVVEFACGAPSMMMGEILPNLARGVDGETVRHPVGVCVGITPFNFPAMVPLWMFPVALVCGNTFVLKPSEKVPLTANLLGELLIEAGVPAGVFNIVHGDKTCVDVLLSHPKVAAVSFVGSTAIAKYVYETGTKNGKRVQAAGGAKNHLIIMPDADLDQAVAALQASAFGCAGERCMAGSVAVSVGNISDELVSRLVQKGAGMSVGPTDTGGEVDMGPLITREHRDRVASYLAIGKSEGAAIALDGRTDAPARGFFLRPSVIDHVKPEMRVAREEIFGPVLSVVRVDALDQALAIGRNSPYGNGASIFTQSGWAAREFKQNFNAGMIGVNIGVPAPMAWFPFTGWNQSFFGDLHIQGRESIQFYTRQKTSMTRWFERPSDAAHDPVWRNK